MAVLVLHSRITASNFIRATICLSLANLITFFFLWHHYSDCTWEWTPFISETGDIHYEPNMSAQQNLLEILLILTYFPLVLQVLCL